MANLSSNINYVDLMTRFWASQIDFFALCIFFIAPSVYLIEDRFIPNGLFDIIGFIFIFLYFSALPRFGRATIGQKLMGYRILPIENQTPQYEYRVFYGIVANMLSILTYFEYRNSKTNVFWWDRKSHTLAVYVT